MKAAVVTNPGTLEVRDVPVPELGPYDALCRMCYGATCAGTDIHLIDGKHPFPVSFPTVLGHESVGRVVEVGARVKNLRVGDLVSRVGYPGTEGLASNWGGFAQYGIARDHWQMKRDGVDIARWNRNRVNQIIHPAIDEKAAPMIITWRETLSYALRLGVGEGKRVVLIGSGGNALSFAAHVHNLGAELAVVGSAAREADFRRQGADAYFSYKDETLGEQLRALCADRGWPGFDVLIDAVGGAETANRVLGSLRRDAVVGVYGWNNRTAYGLNPFLAAGSFRVYADGYDEEETNAQVQSMILRGQLDAACWYDTAHPVPLAEIGDAYDRLRRHEAYKYLISLE